MNSFPQLSFAFLFVLQFMFNTSCFGYDIGLNFLQILRPHPKGVHLRCIKTKTAMNRWYFDYLKRPRKCLKRKHQLDYLSVENDCKICTIIIVLRVTNFVRCNICLAVKCHSFAFEQANESARANGISTEFKYQNWPENCKNYEGKAKKASWLYSFSYCLHHDTLLFLSPLSVLKKAVRQLRF